MPAQLPNLQATTEASINHALSVPESQFIAGRLTLWKVCA